MEQQAAPRRGEVFDCAVPVGDGGVETVTVVVISRDDWNRIAPDDRIWAVPINRHEAPLSVPLTDADHIGGWVQVHGHGMIPRQWLKKLVTTLSGATMQRIRDAFTALQEDIDPV